MDFSTVQSSLISHKIELGLVQKRQVKRMSQSTSKVNQKFEYLIVLDFESTCWDTWPPAGQNEIIEFPAVLLDLSSGNTLSEFHEYVKPTEQSILSSFCKNLTGITQEQVDAGIPLGACLCLFSTWIQKLCEQYQMSFNISVPGKHVTFATWSGTIMTVTMHSSSSGVLIRSTKSIMVTHHLGNGR
nr:ERI1 exoribonuclease 2-like isoform X1 [Cherax quadricarinatus]